VDAKRPVILNVLDLFGLEQRRKALECLQHCALYSGRRFDGERSRA
jgi:hypothetical protein